jgi:hypothetical protein
MNTAEWMNLARRIGALRHYTRFVDEVKATLDQLLAET